MVLRLLVAAPLRRLVTLLRRARRRFALVATRPPRFLKALRVRFAIYTYIRI